MNFTKYEAKVSLRLSVQAIENDPSVPEVAYEFFNTKKEVQAKDWKVEGSEKVLQDTLSVTVEPSNILKLPFTCLIIKEKGVPRGIWSLHGLMFGTECSSKVGEYTVSLSVSEKLIKPEIQEQLLIATIKLKSLKSAPEEAFLHLQASGISVPCAVGSNAYLFLDQKTAPDFFLSTRSLGFELKTLDGLVVASVPGLDIKDSLINLLDPSAQNQEEPFLVAFSPSDSGRKIPSAFIDVDILTPWKEPVSTQEAKTLSAMNPFDRDIWLSGSIEISKPGNLNFSATYSKLVCTFKDTPVKVVEELLGVIFPSGEDEDLQNETEAEAKIESSSQSLKTVLKTDRPLVPTLPDEMSGFTMVFHKPYQVLLVLEGTVKQLLEFKDKLLYGSVTSDPGAAPTSSSANSTLQVLFHPQCVWSERLYPSGWYQRARVRKHARVKIAEELLLCNSIWHARSFIPNKAQVMYVETHLGESEASAYRQDKSKKGEARKISSDLNQDTSLKPGNQNNNTRGIVSVENFTLQKLKEYEKSKFKNFEPMSVHEKFNQHPPTHFFHDILREI